MGIPSYFSYIIKNYPNIIRNLSYITNLNIDHLFMDCNSIIYDAYENAKSMNDTTQYNVETRIIEHTISKIETLIQTIHPTKTVYITFDGVAPLAKQKHQRIRRYRTEFMSDMLSQYMPNTNKWNWTTASITPGTHFMNKLSDAIHSYFGKKTGIPKINISCSKEHGEGEHKIFQFIRDNDVCNDECCIYGLDSDLIMLSILHITQTKNIFVFREAPVFIKSSIHVPNHDKNSFLFMDIMVLSSHLTYELSNKHGMDRISDYIFLCFFLGNDFLPRFPALNIRTTGFQILTDTYRNVISNYGDRYFVINHKIQWKWVVLFIHELSKHEREYIKQEMEMRRKMAKNIQKKYNYGNNYDLTEKINDIPLLYREVEEYICPFEHYWEERYYKVLFECERKDSEQIVQNYKDMLDWVYKYYSKGMDYEIKYKYDHGPLLVDLRKMKDNEIDEHMYKTKYKRVYMDDVSELAQVITEKQKMILLPSFDGKTTKVENGNIEYNMEWAFKRYLWEGSMKI